MTRGKKVSPEKSLVGEPVMTRPYKTRDSARPALQTFKIKWLQEHRIFQKFDQDSDFNQNQVRQTSLQPQLTWYADLVLQPNRCWQGRRLLLWPPLHNPTTDRVLRALISILAPRFFRSVSSTPFCGVWSVEHFEF